jgi:5-methylcytosine-specific restriction protein A
MKPRRRAPHPCATCGRLAWGLRCRPCHRRSTQGLPRRDALSNNWRERKRRAAVVAQHRRAFGDVCPGWQVPPHPATDLAADHIDEVHAGGDERGALAVLCRSCNSRKSNAVRRAMKSGAKTAPRPDARGTPSRDW